LNRTNSKLSEGVDHLEDEVVADSLELVPLHFGLKDEESVRRAIRPKSVLLRGLILWAYKIILKCN
jgi:hypothetical protein